MHHDAFTLLLLVFSLSSLSPSSQTDLAFPFTNSIRFLRCLTQYFVQLSSRDRCSFTLSISLFRLNDNYPFSHLRTSPNRFFRAGLYSLPIYVLQFLAYSIRNSTIDKMAGPFYPPNPTQFPALPNKSKQPGAATYGVDANVVGGAREVTNGLPYNLNTPVNQEVQPGAGTGIELTAYGYEHCGDNHEGGGEATTDQRREHQDGVHNPTESLNPNPVNQGHGVQQTLPQAPPVIAPFENPSYDLGLDLNLPADFLANVELDDSWVNGDTGTSFFDLAPLPEVPEGALGPAGQEFQQPPPNQQETSESGLKFEGDSFERLESVSAKPQTEIAKHEATVNDIPSQEVKAAASTSYFENEIEYQEAEVAPQPQKKEEKKPKKPSKYSKVTCSTRSFGQC